MNKNITQKIAYMAGIATVFVLLFSLVVPTQVLASKDDWGLGDYGYGDSYYYDVTPVYDSYDDYYYDVTPVYDSYDDYYYDVTPVYDSYDDYYYDVTPVYDSYDYDYPTYNPVSYSSPQYYSTPSYTGSTYQPYIPSYSTPTYTPYTPPVYVPTQTQGQNQSNTGVNTNNNSSNSSSSANASSSNTNNNVNNNNNVSNNVNNNNINIVVGTPISATTNQPQNPSLDGSCYISPSNVQINQDVTFTANASGGNGNYSYSWNGSDGISSGSRTFTGRFYNPGTKTANVTITSGGQSINRSCSVNVEQYYNNNNNLGVYCIANPTNASVGQTVVWTAYVTGGNSSYYTYSWYGTDGLSYGNANSIQKSYQTAGSKTATVTVYGNNNQSVSASCYTNITGYTAPISNVTVIRQPTVGTPVSGVYLSQIPATGIAGSMKVALFALGLIIWSAFVGYILVSRKNKLALVSGNGNGLGGANSANASDLTPAQRIQAFKLENMRKRGLIK